MSCNLSVPCTLCVIDRIVCYAIVNCKVEVFEKTSCDMSTVSSCFMLRLWDILEFLH